MRGSLFFEIVQSIVKTEIHPKNHVSFFKEVDLTQAESLRQKMDAADGRKPSYTAMVTKALAIALAEFPYANRRVHYNWWRGHRIQQFENIDISVQAAMDGPDNEVATFADILRNADTQSLQSIKSWLVNLPSEDNEQWKKFSGLIHRLPLWLAKILIRLPVVCPNSWVKYRGGAAVVNSPARFGVDFLSSTWTWPLTVSFGLVKDRPRVKQNQVVPCKTFHLILCFDRRIMAGAPAARFFNRLVNIIENANTELTE